MTRHPFIAALATGGFLLAGIAQASAVVVVIGSSIAHSCFVAAKTGANAVDGIAMCSEALKEEGLSPHDEAGTHVNRGVLENILGQQDNALSDFNQALSIYPLGDAYIDRGATLISLSRYDEAMADINKGIDLGPSYPHIGYYNRAVAEELMGRWKESYYDFKHVLELEPNFTKASDQLKNFIVTTTKSAPS
jgi:tetratricopeptide (TPR) repeat protein